MALRLPQALAEMGPYILTAWTSSCSLPSAENESTVSYLLRSLQFVLFGSCPQRIEVSTVHLVFLGIVILLGVFKISGIRQPKLNTVNAQASMKGKKEAKRTHVGILFTITFVVVLCVAIAHTAVAVWRIGYGLYYGWQGIPAQELVFSISQALAWIIFVVIVGHQKQYSSTKYSAVIRLWWVVTFCLSVLTLWSTISRFLHHEPRTLQLWVDDIVILATMPAVACLLIVAYAGVTGITVEESESAEPLLGHSEESGHEVVGDGVTRFASANFFSKLTMMWLNPLLKTGKARPLDANDVPFLAPSDQAEYVYARFKENYDSQLGIKSAKHAIVKTYWPQLVFTALLSLLKLSVMYVGPLLIDPISDYVSQRELFPYEGYVLVGILLLAKVVEVLCSHHYTFYSNKLGMVVRSSLITSVYRKGLKITSHARQTHGTGQITNYMTVDVQMIADCLAQVHNLWILPLQVIGALLILYGVVGLSSFGGILTMLCFLSASYVMIRRVRKYQFQVMMSKDARMAATTEALNGMKIIKLQSWEDYFKAKIEDARLTEWNWLRKFQYWLALNIFLSWQSPIMVAIATFGLCALVGEQLTPARVFTALATFRIMQEPLRLFPTAMTTISQALNSFDRLDKFFLSEELDEAAVERIPPGSEFAVEVEGGEFKWDAEANVPTLRDIDFRVPRGSLVAVVGMVGSGKSSLLSAILGEVPKSAGKVTVSGSFAYVAQGAWIQNATIEDNIRFGKDMNFAKYRSTLQACALEEDLKQMDFGDKTEIGERGINLSGGQKQRIQLARAVYQDSDIYLLDDIFSAVDAHTGSELFDKCIKGALAHKTVVLVTHQVEFLNGADLILVMRDGQIVQSGRYNELLDAGTDLSALVAAHNEAMNKVETSEDAEDLELSQGELSPELALSLSKRNLLEKRSSSRSSSLRSSMKKKGVVIEEGNAKLVEEERRETGQVSRKLYWLYVTKSFFGIPFACLLLLQTAFQVIQIASDFYLADVTSEEKASTFKPSRFILTYAVFGLGCGIALLLRTLTNAIVGLRTTQGFFLSMLNRIFKAPMSFFDTTPGGRILTRFSTDQTNMDFPIPINFGIILGTGSQALGIVFVVCSVSPQLILLVFPLAVVFVIYQNYYIASSRELTRIDSVTKAPIVHHFSETIDGFVTIRAFGEEARFSKENVSKVNDNLRMDFHNNAGTEWLGLRIEMIGSTVLCLSALLMVAFRDYIASDLVGLSLSYGLALNGCLYGVVLFLCQLENKMVSVERINQYCFIESEAAAVIPENRPAPTWPESGNLHFQRLELRYRPSTPLVLKGISLYIRDGEKVGVVGRTGSGKSTLIQALFRLVEPAGGSIVVDGIDITTIGLKDLRSRFSIIPQEPTLFKGSVRFNMDPLGEHSDKDIWESLEKCQLADVLRDKVEKLDTEVQENGENWSVGQRQLFCLGRALLKRSRILVLDEATASVDSQTDAVIQTTIRSEFKSSTVISIAHRIPTVMDSDKVLVLDAGHVKEFDSPSRLLDQHSSLFAALVREYTTRSGGA